MAYKKFIEDELLEEIEDLEMYDSTFLKEHLKKRNKVLKKRKKLNNGDS